MLLSSTEITPVHNPAVVNARLRLAAMNTDGFSLCSRDLSGFLSEKIVAEMPQSEALRVRGWGVWHSNEWSRLQSLVTNGCAEITAVVHHVINGDICANCRISAIFWR
jgi:hypothetical protein